MYSSVDEQTPPVSLTLNHLPFQGRHGRFALRADSIRPYRWRVPFNERLCPVRLRADAIRPDSGVDKTAALQSAHSPEPIIFLSIRGNAEHIRRTQLRNSAADGLVNLNQLL